MAKRLFSTLLLWGIVAAVFISNQAWAFIATIFTLTFLGAVEFNRLTREAPGYQRRMGALTVSGIYLLWLAWDLLNMSYGKSETTMEQGLTSFLPEMVGMFATLFLAFFMSLRRKIVGHESINAVGLSLISFCYVPVLFGGFMMRLTFLSPAFETGPWLLLFVAVVTKFTDMGAYLSGTLFGKTKMVKHISPGKTWEGTMGSFLFALLGAFAVCYFAGEKLDWIGPWWSILILSILISVSAIIGDLAESILKRSMEVKDSGATLPGIGGVLDLIDSICFSAPVVFFYLLCFEF